MKMLKANSFWIFSFTLMFFLALDYWAWKQPVALSWFNFPTWVF